MQEPVARKAPGRNAHSPTLHKHNIVQVTACILKPDKQATIQRFFYCQKFTPTNNYVSSRSGTTWKKLWSASPGRSPVLLFGTDAIIYRCKFVPTNARTLLVYTTDCKLQKKHVQYRFTDAFNNLILFLFLKKKFSFKCIAFTWQ